MTEPRKILLIDCEAPPRFEIEAVRTPRGHSFCRVTEAQAAFEAARAQSFDAVLIAAERADALRLTKRFASAEGGSQAVIAVTQDASRAAAAPLLAAGALDWIARDEADAAALARVLRHVCARRGDLQELHKAREDAEGFARALARGNRERAMILSFIAHDLRNPFHVLLNMSRTLAESAAADAQVARRAAGIQAAAAQAHGVLETLYAWATQRQNAGAVAPEPFAADTLLRSCAEVWRERADSRRIRLDVDRSDLWVVAHEAAAAAILRNLVDNALKFTGPGGFVTLAAERRGARVALSVYDTGVGMSEAEAARVLSGERRAVSAAGGLGLLLCRDLAEWIGGELDVQSRPGLGSTFRLTLPAAAAPAAPRERVREISEA